MAIEDRYLDVVMTEAPHPDGEFVELEDEQGRSVGEDTASWVKNTDDPHWRLRIPVRANLGMATNTELIQELAARFSVGHTDADYTTVEPL